MGQLSELHSKLLELRLEARAIAAERSEEPNATRGRLESRALADATEHLWRVLDALYGKANFNPNQPRVPRGNPDGGQWTDDPAFGGGEGRLQTGRSATRRRTPQGPRGPKNPRGTGSRGPLPPPPAGTGDDAPIRPDAVWPDNAGPITPRESSRNPPARIESPSDLPAKQPAVWKQALRYAKGAANWVSRQVAKGAKIATAAIAVINVAPWLRKEWPNIVSFADRPMTLEQLYARGRGPMPGYELHHIRERDVAEKLGDPPSLIHGDENVILVPKWKHQLITGHYARKPDEDTKSLRELTMEMDADQRLRIGLEVLRAYGVLK